PSRQWLRAVPAWAWLVAIVARSTLFRALVGRDMPGPFIFVDALIYSQLVKSVAAGRHLLLRRAPTAGHPPPYPLLISPAHRLARANQPCVPSLQHPALGVRGGHGGERAGYLARRGPRLLPGAPAGQAGARPARRAAPRGGPLARVHGHGDDGERLLPVVPLRR